MAILKLISLVLFCTFFAPLYSIAGTSARLDTSAVLVGSTVMTTPPIEHISLKFLKQPLDHGTAKLILEVCSPLLSMSGGLSLPTGFLSIAEKTNNRSLTSKAKVLNSSWSIRDIESPQIELVWKAEIVIPQQNGKQTRNASILLGLDL